MALYDPPLGLMRALHAFDPALRVRWSDAQGCWRLERKATRGTVWPPSIHDTPAAYEDRIAAGEGYILVDTINKNDLDDRLLPILKRNDIWSRGGADTIAKEFDRLDAEHLATMKRMVSEKWADMARERYRYMNAVRTLPEHKAHAGPDGGMSINGGL